jgi:hypothetical protein
MRSVVIGLAALCSRVAAAWQRRLQYAPAPGWSALDTTLADRVDVSVLMQYWGQGRSVEYAEGTARTLRDLAAHLRATTRSFEILVNSDSRHVRHGDARTLLDALGGSGFLLLSQNRGEAFALNALARFARGEHLLFVQDDWGVRFSADGPGTFGWLDDALALFGRGRAVGLVGLDEGVRRNTCVRPLPLAKQLAFCTKFPRPSTSYRGADGVHVGCGPTVQDETASADGATKPCRHGSGVERVSAQRCVTMGPLLMRRALFAHLGGFDESVFQKGRPSTLLDCELSARVWSANLAVVLVTPLT